MIKLSADVNVEEKVNERSLRLTRYPYIAIEGVNLSGKSTAVNYIKEHSKYKKYIDVYHEPDENTILGKFIRENVSKENQIKDFVVKNVLYLLGIKENTYTSFKKYRVHLTSRSILSNIVYSELNPNYTINIINTLRVKIPDLIIMINASNDLLEKRFNESKERDVVESKGIKFLLEKQEIMKQTISKYSLFKNNIILNVDINNENLNDKILELVDNKIDEWKLRYNK